MNGSGSHEASIFSLCDWFVCAPLGGSSNRLWMTIISLDSSHPMIRRRQRIRHLANGLRIDYLVNGAYAAPTPGIWTNKVHPGLYAIPQTPPIAHDRTPRSSSHGYQCTVASNSSFFYRATNHSGSGCITVTLSIMSRFSFLIRPMYLVDGIS